jgi:hypothetical protein
MSVMDDFVCSSLHRSIYIYLGVPGPKVIICVSIISIRVVL